MLRAAMKQDDWDAVESILADPLIVDMHEWTEVIAYVVMAYVVMAYVIVVYVVMADPLIVEMHKWTEADPPHSISAITT